MTQDAAAAAQRFVDSYNAHDIDRVLELVADDFTFVDHPMAETFDRQTFEGWLREGLVTFPDAALVDVRHIASGASVVSLFVEEATHDGPLPTLDGEIGATGRRVVLPICFVLEVGGDGLFHTGETYYDMDSLVRQVQ